MKTIKKTSLLFCLTIIVFTLFTIFTINLNAQSLSSQKDEQDEASTVVHHGQTTEKEKLYSIEYRKFYPHHPIRKYTFTELINLTIKMGKTTDEIRVLGLEPDIPGDPDAPPVTPAQFLTKLTCKANTVVLGSVKDKIAHMNDDETSVYSEYPFLVTRVLKNNIKSPIRVNNLIEVTRPGGVIELDGRRIRVEDRTYPFLKKDQPYILFLRFFPSTGGYTVASFEGDFSVENNSFKILNRVSPPMELQSGDKLSELLSDIENLASTKCSDIMK